MGKARERNAEKKKKLQVKPAEAGGRSFQQQGMLYYRIERQVLPKGVGVRPHVIEPLFSEFVLTLPHPFSTVAPTSQLFSILTTFLSCSHFFSFLPTSAHLFSPLPRSLFSTLLNSSQRLSPLPTSSQLFSTRLNSSTLLPPRLSSSHLFSPPLNSSHLFLSSSQLFSPSQPWPTLLNSSHLLSQRCLHTEQAFTRRSFHTQQAFTHSKL